MSVNSFFDVANGGSSYHAYDQELWLRLIRDRRWTTSQKRQLLGIGELIEDFEHVDVYKLLNSSPKSITKQAKPASVKRDLQWLQVSDQHLITYFDPRYPEMLRQVSDPPIALFAKGSLDLLNAPKVAIVGSRMPTPVGEKVTAEIASTLGCSGVAVVSGLAMGIDGVAHSAAIQTIGSSIAVVGNGLDVVYPSRQKQLHCQLHDLGLIVSEYPLGQSPTRYTFPQRNRIISGLSHGVVIVEAANKSGTLITARLAMEQNRELMVVPGAALSHQYAGSHRLIKDGASLVCCGQDVLLQLSAPLQEYCLDVVQPRSEGNLPELSAAQGLVLDLLSSDSTNVDTLVEKSSLTAAEVSAILLELELVGVAATTREGGYVRTV